MANQENVELLKTGVTGWNEFRKEHQEVSPDLRARAKTTSDFSASSPSPREERTGRGPGRGAPIKMFELRLRLGTYFCTDPKQKSKPQKTMSNAEVSNVAIAPNAKR